MSVTITQLRTFLAVARLGSVKAAAAELVVTQPSVSAAVTALARELGVDLLERQGRGVQPTAAGREYATYAADVIGLLEEGRRAACQAESGSAPALRIAAVTTAAESFVPPLMQAFAVLHPEIALSLEVGNRERVLALVLAHETDVAVGGRPPRDERIEAHPMLPNELVLVTAVDDPLTRQGAVGADELERRRWLMREPGSGTRIANEEFLGRTGISVETLTLGSNGAIKQAARAGLGVSFVSRDAVATELGAGLLGTIEVAAGPPARQWYVMRSAVGPARVALDEFMAFVVPGSETRLQRHAALVAGRAVRRRSTQPTD
ncbi:MAG: LysR family transcriptional regulator [Actinomycetota bacterium]|nr:LysR family transcriptional regulator [Actinomycetota bacterium]